MATRRLYYDDSFQDNFSAQVLSCEPLTEAEDGGFGPRWGVILDQTLLYPTSGGQPHDLGKLGDANVVDVREKDDDRIVHFVDRPVPAGRIDGCIDWSRRFDHMQQHTGQHLLSAVFEELFRLHTVSFHLGAESATIDLEGGAVDARTILETERRTNELVFANRPVTVTFEEAEDVQGLRKPSGRQGTLRIVS